MDEIDLKCYREVQSIAKKTIEFLNGFIKKGVSEIEISQVADDYMISKGIDSFWYYDVGALVLVGDRTILSISGREYKPTDKLVNTNDLVTVDLSPQVNGYWGDYARLFVISEGKVTNLDDYLSKGDVIEQVSGLKTEKELHNQLLKIARPDMTFNELYEIMNNKIIDFGFSNLDFKGNLGHSIEKRIEDRKYIEKGNNLKLSEVFLFTFEPHIQKIDGLYGYKMENIYYFKENTLQEL